MSKGTILCPIWTPLFPFLLCQENDPTRCKAAKQWIKDHLLKWKPMFLCSLNLTWHGGYFAFCSLFLIAGYCRQLPLRCTCEVKSGKTNTDYSWTSCIITNIVTILWVVSCLTSTHLWSIYNIKHCIIIKEEVNVRFTQRFVWFLTAPRDKILHNSQSHLNKITQNFLLLDALK